MPIKANDILIFYFQLVYVEKMKRIIIDGDKYNLNTGNSIDCTDISISDNVADELIANSINFGGLTGFSGDAAGGLVAAINAINLMNCDDILI